MITSEFRWMLRYMRRQLAPRARLRAFCAEWKAWQRFWQSYRQYNALAEYQQQLDVEYLYPCINDATAQTQIEPVYFYQDAWAFAKIVAAHPVYHVDIGSHHKYVALLSKVVPVTMVDIRPLSLSLDTLAFQSGSILDLPFADASLPSVSSLCVVEHIGLGRYGDPLDPKGTEKALAELKRIVQPGGDLYISLPLDDENRVYFNAHRAFTEEYLIQLYQPFWVIESRYIYGETFGSEKRSGFGIGCYHLRRPL